MGADTTPTTVGDLFERPPMQFGFRGDPWLWAALRERLAQTSLPIGGRRSPEPGDGRCAREEPRRTRPVPWSAPLAGPEARGGLAPRLQAVSW
ncbi:hypothetical protein EDF64_101376 [Curtobacterium flaccumfaciens]|uniref:Uncharacterized protein n=1 Tax=Curtobacterium flaccumfaciens TaxID=2035 RepID=A0A4R6DNN0_9MICO|nr:hypothetical protein [Curtobacterium flaccumfaciens]TDN46510.1 hypothetical protein EDF64_101376 [Curtobacterium flaccumfaciens]